MSWFENWFNSEYYHILYQHRDFEEAERFIREIATHLNLPKKSRILDLACGKGRHSIFMNELGFNVVGIDLSAESISSLEHLNSESLKFIKGDMRDVYESASFDYVFNLFTSFGYFDSDEENAKVIQSISKSLKPHGIGLIDFLNENHVRSTLPNEEWKTINAIDFKIKRYEHKHSVIKSIEFTDNGEIHSYSEKVKLYDLSTFERFFQNAGLKLIDVFGNYALEPLDIDSDRLIMIFEKY